MAGALAMTAGCCGTINPNGCQFQYSTCSSLDMKDPNGVIKSANRSSYCHDYHTCISDVLFWHFSKGNKMKILVTGFDPFGVNRLIQL